jgi:alkylglycerol monooxygenase
MNPNYILLAIPFFLITVIGEWLHNYLKHRGKDFDFADSITNLNLGIGSQAIGALGKAGLIMGYDWLVAKVGIWDIGFTWYNFIICVIVFDYIYYWAHRWGHEWNIFWGAHIVHHQSQEYNLTVALRQSWFHNLIAFPLFLPIPFIGFDTMTFVAAAGFVTLYQYWIHTKLIGNMGKWFEFIFNTPSHHRVHHATNPKYLDKNYAATFILWDRLHGTFVQEEEEPTYGITVPFNSWNPVWANLHFYVEMWEGSKRLKTLREKLVLVFKGPEYLGRLLGQVKDGVQKHVPAPKFRTETPVHLMVYVALQFVLLTYFLVAYMGKIDELSLFYQLAFFFLICVSTLSVGAILENKPWFYIVEIARYLMFLVIYNLCYYTYYPDWFTYSFPFSVAISVGFTLWMLADLYVRRLRPMRARH